jgi:hypothetical protein
MKDPFCDVVRMTETIALPPVSVFRARQYPKVVFPEDPLHVVPQLWTKPELVEWTQSSPEFISGEIRAGRLKGVYLSSGRLRFHWGDIVDWLQARTRAMHVRRGLSFDE